MKVIRHQAIAVEIETQSLSLFKKDMQYRLSQPRIVKQIAPVFDDNRDEVNTT